MLAVFFLQYVELVRSKFRGAVMRVFRDRRADSDRSLRLGWTIFVWLMTRQLVSDVDLVEQAELDRLEGLPPCLHVLVIEDGARIYEQVCAERSWVFFATGATGVTYL